MTGDSRRYQLCLPDSMPTIEEWLSVYGERVPPDELYKLAHYKNQEIPRRNFIVWINRALMGTHRGWIFRDVSTVRRMTTVWYSPAYADAHSIKSEKRRSSAPLYMSADGWYYIEKVLAMPFTDVPAF
jgi:hypothetical protein